MYRSPTVGNVELSEALTRAMVEHFGLNEVSLTPIRSGPLSIAWECRGIRGSEPVRWCVKGHRTRKTQVIDLESEFTRVWQSLVGKLIPKTVPCDDGPLWFAVGDRFFSAHEFIAADQPFNWTCCTWSAGQTRAAGQGLATFHLGSESIREALGDGSLAFAGSVMPKVRNVFAKTLAGVTDDHRRADPLLDSIPEPTLLRRLDKLLLALDAENSVLYLVHGDYHPGNLLFRADELVAILDLEDVHYEDLLFDVGYGALSFAGKWGRLENPTASQEFSEEFLDSELMSAFLEGYNELAFKSAVGASGHPVTKKTIEKHVQLAGFLVLQWLLEMYLKEPDARSGLSSPLKDCLKYLLTCK